MVRAYLKNGPIPGTILTIPTGYSTVSLDFVAETNRQDPSATPKPQRHVYIPTGETTDAGESILEWRSVP